MYLQIVQTTVQRWGNSLALRIPKAFAEETHIKHGTAVDISLSKGTLVMRPIKRSRVTLRSLLSDVKPENLNIAPFDDPPRGREMA
jgi:antitoxin MazE